MTCALAPQTPVEKCAQSALEPVSGKTVASMRNTLSAIARRKPRWACAINVVSMPQNAAGCRHRLASAKVERFTAAPPR